jgi:hypothetical protein
LVGADPTEPPKNFVQNLGRVFNLPDSIRIATALDRDHAADFTASGVSRSHIREGFLRARAALVGAVLRQLVPGDGSARLRFPTANPAAGGEPPSLEAYLGFYAALQRDVDFKIRNLQAGIREEVASVSPTLAQLAALDASLGEPLAFYSRGSFAAVPGLLRPRIESILGNYRQASALDRAAGNLWRETETLLRTEIQESLLAELDTRLLPTLGLLEALEELGDD